MIDRKTVICFIVGILAGIILSTTIFFIWAGSIRTDFDKRIQQITKQYDNAVEAQQRAIAESNELRQLNSELESRIAESTRIAESLRAENRELAKRISKLLEFAKVIRGTLSEIAEGLGGSEGILQDSLRVLCEIAERNGVKVNGEGIGN